MNLLQVWIYVGLVGGPPKVLVRDGRVGVVPGVTGFGLFGDLWGVVPEAYIFG
jgi:hypothetical protein